MFSSATIRMILLPNLLVPALTLVSATSTLAAVALGTPATTLASDRRFGEFGHQRFIRHRRGQFLADVGLDSRQ